MRTRVARLKKVGGDVAIAWFMGDTGETFIFGSPPLDLSTEVEADDYEPLISCRFMVRGSVTKTNQFREEIITPTTPFETTGNLKWCRFTIREDDTVGFCLDTTNVNHRVIAPYRFILAPNESMTLSIVGFVVAADGTITINNEAVGDREIVTLSGTTVTIVAGPEGAQVGALEIEHI